MSVDSGSTVSERDTSAFDAEGMTEAAAEFLRAAGLASAASGTAPARCAEAWRENLLCGYGSDPVEILRPTWPERAGEIVAVTGVPFLSVCAHHLLPFFGRAHVAYAPADELTGLSRIEDLVHCLSRRLQLQESLGEQIAESLVEGVGARGAAVVLEAEHLCVFARGRRQRGTVTRSVAFAGALRDDAQFQDRCLACLQPTAVSASGAPQFECSEDHDGGT